MNSSQLSTNREEVESFMPRPMTVLPFSLSLETSGEKSLSPVRIAKVSMCPLEWAMSMASTTMRMSAEFLPAAPRLGTSISSMAASWSAVL